jgi:uncharacterized protein
MKATMFRAFRAVILLLLILPLTACGISLITSSYSVEPLDQFPLESVIINVHDRSHPFTLWVAQTAARRSQGLTTVRRLDADQGMLFLFDQPTRPAMWMKNMAIPLDLLFISADGKVLHVARDITADSQGTIQPDDAVTAVIELPGGTATRLHLEAGAKIHHAYLFREAPQTLTSLMKSSPLRIARN